MTNEEAKQQFIREAYGDKYDHVCKFMEGNGWVQRKVTGHGITNGMEPEKFRFKREDVDILVFSADGRYSWRAKLLNGIENNNGWTRIEPDGSNLPERSAIIMWTIWLINELTTLNVNSNGVRSYFKSGRTKHYKPIIEEPKPIY